VLADVVIVAHNSGALLGEAVASAVQQAGAEHVWVMDAESTDGSTDALRERAGDVQVVPVANAGFSASNNRGLELGRSPFVLLLNPDAALLPGALDRLVASAQAHPRAGVIGPLVLNPDGSVQANSFGRFPSLYEQSALRVWRMVQRLRGNSKKSPRAPDSPAPVDWVTGAAMFARREAVEAVGPMDEAFFLYYEDIEWCHRMRDHGWDVLLEPSARVVHHLNGSVGDASTLAAAYRASFYHYCDLYGLWGLKASARAGLVLRRLLGGAA